MMVVWNTEECSGVSHAFICLVIFLHIWRNAYLPTARPENLLQNYVQDNNDLKVHEHKATNG